MQPEIRDIPLEFTLHGYSMPHDPAQAFSGEIMKLLGRLWPVLKANAIASDGINRVVYDKAGTGGLGAGGGGGGGCVVFAGVMLKGAAAPQVDAGEVGGLERRTVRLTRYACWKHIGPYAGIPTTGAAMTKSLAEHGERTTWPMVEVYGHWTNDESKLETETFVALK